MAKVFVFDHAICNGCYNCQIACKDEHCGNDWLPYSKSQPNTGHFWMKLLTQTHGQVPRVRDEFKPVMCQHCENPVCLDKSNAFYRREDGLIILDPEKATEKDILDACPYGVIYWNDTLGIAQKCNGCAHLVDEGEPPHCVDLCAFQALRFGDEEEFAGELEGAELYHPEYGTSPHVYYRNLPHLFIGGGVYDPVDMEIVKGAVCTLEPAAGDTLVTESDEFGDFWFRRIEAGSYRLQISAEGYETIEQEIILEKSLSLDDYALVRIAQNS